MGQYHLVVSLTKREFIDPHKLGNGLKLWEQLASHPSTGAALLALLACSNGRGGGDLKDDPAVIGRWAGDRIAVVGDYAERGDLPDEFEAENIYEACSEGRYKDISESVAALLERELEGKFIGDGWRQFWRQFVFADDDQSTRAMKPDMVITSKNL